MASQQEQRTVSVPLSRSASKNPCSPQRLILLPIMLSPLLLISPVIYFLSLYNDAISHTTQQQAAAAAAAQQSYHRTNVQQIKLSDLKLRGAKNRNAKETLLLKTTIGTIRIVLRPDLSEESVDYIHRLVDSDACTNCNLYRAERPGILQGVMKNPTVPINKVLGPCPDDGKSEVVKNDCPKWDEHCGCHGPIMTKGAVGWAAGTAGGPDFFIDSYEQPARWWGTQHTNFGRIEDEESFRIIDGIWNLPVINKGGMTLLRQKLHFTLELEESSTF